MGYRKPRKLYHLVWPEGHELHGLELEMRGLSIGQLTSLSARLGSVTGAQDMAAQYGEVFALFASKLVSWTLEDDDGPVPATAEGVAAQADDDPMFMISLVMAWADAVASVDTPLPNGSIPGPPSGLEASLPMAPLSQSPSS